MINGELSVFLLTCMSANTNVTHGIKARLMSFWSFGMYLSFEPKKNSFRQSADSQSTKYSVSELMVDPVYVKRVSLTQTCLAELDWTFSVFFDLFQVLIFFQHFIIFIIFTDSSVLSNNHYVYLHFLGFFRFSIFCYLDSIIKK